ncbi:MAG: glycosyltransferase [Actinobacteria bacterium]|nr:glycosyltransferase [Actinomycetota bacterium]
MKRYKLIKNTSFISTVCNEEKSLPDFLRSFFEQDYLPEEIIIVDGGSRDRTLDVLKDFFINKLKSNYNLLVFEDTNAAFQSNSVISNSVNNISIQNIFHIKIFNESNKDSFEVTVKLLQKINAGISEGRNIAIRNAQNEIICASDAGCIFDKNWTYEITKFLFPNKNEINKFDNPIIQGSYDVVGGYSKSIAVSFMEKVLSICIMPQLKEIKPQKFMPSSRNISYKKSAWEKVGGYPENLDFGEDMKFNFNLKNNGYFIKFNPDAVIFWRMRENIIQVFKQFFRYSKGDAKGKMYLYRHFIRFLSVVIFIVILLISIIFSPWFLTIYIPFFSYYVYKPFSRLNVTFKHHKNKTARLFLKISALIVVPLMLIYIDIAKMAGFIYGLIKK